MTSSVPLALAFLLILIPANPRFPSCEPSQSATQLKLHTVLPQVSKQFLVGIGGRHVPVGIVRAVVLPHMARISVKDRNHLRRRVPFVDVAHTS